MTLRQRNVAAVAALFLSLVLAGPLKTQAQDASALLALSTSPKNEPISLTLHEPKLRYHFTVDSLKDEVKDVQVTATPFRDATGGTFQPTVKFGESTTGASQIVGLLKSIPVIIEADLPNPGVYTSHISLVYGGKKWTPVTLSVTRTAPDLEVRELTAGRATMGLFERRPSVLLETGICEKTGQGSSLPIPQLVKFDQKETKDASFTRPVSLTVRGEGGQPLTAPIEVGKQKISRHLFFELDGIGAGEYTGTLLFTSTGSIIEKPISVFVRESWFVALLWIALGVIVSYFLRKYLLTSRPRLLVLARIESLTADLQGIHESRPLTTAQDKAALFVLGLVEDVPKAINLEAMSITEADAALDILVQKEQLLRDWVNFHRQATQPIPPALQDAFEQAERTLLNRSADLVAIKQASETLVTASTANNAARARGARQAADTPRKAATNRLHRILRWLRSFDVLVTLIILAIACLMGINTLWIGNLAWGGAKDFVIAVLWGLGLHQVAFSGIDALRAQLIKPS